jgi:hypothetical protein
MFALKETTVSYCHHSAFVSILCQKIALILQEKAAGASSIPDVTGSILLLI